LKIYDLEPLSNNSFYPEITFPSLLHVKIAPVFPLAKLQIIVNDML